MPLLTTVADALLEYMLGDGHDGLIPYTFYVGLSTTDPATAITEPSVGGYARGPIANDSASWSVASGGAKTNLVPVVLPEASADYPEVAWFVLFDAATGGQAVVSGALTAPVTVVTGRTPRFVAGSLTVTLG